MRRGLNEGRMWPITERLAARSRVLERRAQRVYELHQPVQHVEGCSDPRQRCFLCGQHRWDEDLARREMTFVTALVCVPKCATRAVAGLAEPRRTAP